MQDFDPDSLIRGDEVDTCLESEYQERHRPDFPLRNFQTKEFVWSQASLTPSQFNLMKGPADGNNRQVWGDLQWMSYINRRATPIYLFDASGLKASVIETTKGYEHAYSRGNITVEIIQSVVPDTELAKKYGITNKTLPEHRFIKGKLDLRDEDFIGEDCPGSVYIPEIGMFISLSPDPIRLLRDENQIPILRSWLREPEYLLNCDIKYKTVAFVNDGCPINSVYSSSDGKIIDEVYLIRTPVVPAGEIYFRVNTILSNGSRQTHTEHAYLSEIEQQGGLIIHHTLSVGIDLKSFSKWCGRHPLRNMRFSYDEGDSFTSGINPEKELLDFKREVKDTKKESERKGEIIDIYRSRAQSIITKSKKSGQTSMSDVDKLLKDITQGLDAPPEPMTFKEKTKTVSEIASSVYKSVDSVYKIGVAVAAGVGLVAGLIYKFWPKGN